MPHLPIASSWFERRTIGGGVTLLWEPHVHPLLRCNLWHVRGRDCDLLIDTGMGIASLKQAAAELFDRPLIVVLTHTHMDHCGGAHEFGEVCVHSEEGAALAEASNHLSLDIAAWDAETISWLAATGYDISAGLITAIPHAGFDPASHRLAPAAATRVVGEGEMISTGDRTFEVLHLPGHSPGSIGLWEQRSGVLFSGDAIYDGPLLDSLPGSDAAVYRRTMERLRDLRVEVVHAGHDPSFGRDRLVELATAYLEGRKAS